MKSEKSDFLKISKRSLLSFLWQVSALRRGPLAWHQKVKTCCNEWCSRTTVAKYSCQFCPVSTLHPLIRNRIHVSHRVSFMINLSWRLTDIQYSLGVGWSGLLYAIKTFYKDIRPEDIRSKLIWNLTTKPSCFQLCVVEHAIQSQSASSFQIDNRVPHSVPIFISKSPWSMTCD